MTTNYAIHANGTFWGIFAAANQAEAIQNAADEIGTEGNTDGMTATEAGQHILYLRDACAANDCPMTDIIRELFNCHDAEISEDGGIWISEDGGIWISEDGGIWISQPQTGHWLNPDRLADVIRRVEG